MLPTRKYNLITIILLVLFYFSKTDGFLETKDISNNKRNDNTLLTRIQYQQISRKTRDSTRLTRGHEGTTNFDDIRFTSRTNFKENNDFFDRNSNIVLNGYRHFQNKILQNQYRSSRDLQMSDRNRRISSRDSSTSRPLNRQMMHQDDRKLDESIHSRSRSIENVGNSRSRNLFERTEANRNQRMRQIVSRNAKDSKIIRLLPERNSRELIKSRFSEENRITSRDFPVQMRSNNFDKFEDARENFKIISKRNVDRLTARHRTNTRFENNKENILEGVARLSRNRQENVRQVLNRNMRGDQRHVRLDNRLLENVRSFQNENRIRNLRVSEESRNTFRRRSKESIDSRRVKYVEHKSKKSETFRMRQNRISEESTSGNFRRMHVLDIDSRNIKSFIDGSRTDERFTTNRLSSVKRDNTERVRLTNNRIQTRSGEERFRIQERDRSTMNIIRRNLRTGSLDERNSRINNFRDSKRENFERINNKRVRSAGERSRINEKDRSQINIGIRYHRTGSIIDNSKDTRREISEEIHNRKIRSVDDRSRIQEKDRCKIITKNLRTGSSDERNTRIDNSRDTRRETLEEIRNRRVRTTDERFRIQVGDRSKTNIIQRTLRTGPLNERNTRINFKNSKREAFERIRSIDGRIKMVNTRDSRLDSKRTRWDQNSEHSNLLRVNSRRQVSQYAERRLSDSIRNINNLKIQDADTIARTNRFSSIEQNRRTDNFARETLSNVRSSIENRRNLEPRVIDNKHIMMTSTIRRQKARENSKMEFSRKGRTIEEHHSGVEWMRIRENIPKNNVEHISQEYGEHSLWLNLAKVILLTMSFAQILYESDSKKFGLKHIVTSLCVSRKEKVY